MSYKATLVITYSNSIETYTMNLTTFKNVFDSALSISQGNNAERGELAKSYELSMSKSKERKQYINAPVRRYTGVLR